MSNSIFTVCKSVGGAHYEIDTDKARLDRGLIHDFLARSHWAKGLPRAVLERALEHSLAFGLYSDGRQVGFARVVTDHATFAYLADVFVVAPSAARGSAAGWSRASWRIRSFRACAAGSSARATRMPSIAATASTSRRRPLPFLERHDPTIYTRARTARRAGRTLAEPRPAY
jgi:hypothetical protein